MKQWLIFALVGSLTACAVNPSSEQQADRLAAQAHRAAEQGQTEAAQILADGALAISPQHVAASFERAWLRLGQGEVNAAIADLDWVVSQQPDNMRYLGARCVARAVAGLPDALSDCDRAQALSGNVTNAWIARGQALLAMQRPTDALAAFEAALASTPNAMRALYGRGVARWRLGDAEKGQADCLAAFSRLPGAAREYTHPKLGRAARGA